MILFALALVAAPQPGPLKLFKDWTVGCDNVRNCQAVALLHDETAEDGLTMRLTRGAAPDAPVRIVIETSLGALGDKAGAVGLAVDGKRIPGRLTEVEGGAAVDAAGTAALLAALRTGSSLDAVGADGKKVGSISLAGATAALLYMDERQKRVGTVTALARPGAKPASAVPPPPPLPEIVLPARPAKPARAMPFSLAAALRRKACDGGDERDDQSPAETFRLDAAHTLAIVPDHCDSGAYNHASLLYVAGDTGPWQPALYDTEQEKAAKGGPDPLAFNADWDAKAATLETFMKGRGLGDCGSRQRYAWDGARFRLFYQEEMRECLGSLSWIPTWRARVVRR